MTRQFCFAGTQEDSIEILESLLATPTTQVLVDRWYSVPDAPMFRSLSSEMRRDFASHRALFLWDARYSKRTVAFLHIPGATVEGEYKIHGSSGGPLLQLVLPADFVKDGQRWIRPGGMTCQSQYLDDPEGAYGAWSLAKEFYEEKKKLISKHLRSFQVDGTKRRLGFRCAEALRTGSLNLHWMGK